jgi:crossover junction endodeoxyribonuclease RuvC
MTQNLLTEKIILGIDPGTAKMGYSLLKFGSKSNKKFYLELITSQVIQTSPELNLPRRLKILYNTLTQLVKIYKPDTMSVERIFFNTNAKTAINVGQARGVALLVAAQKNLDVFEYTALEAKMVLTGYGRSDKKQMQEAVQKTLKLKEKIKSDDANDAVAIALCHVKKFYEIGKAR